MTAATVAVPLRLKDRIAPVTAATSAGSATPDADAAFRRERERRAALVRRYVGDGPETVVPVRVLRFGGVTLVGVPGEANHALQDALSLAHPDDRVLVCNVVNGWYGYFPPHDIYDRPAVYAAEQSPFAPGCHEAIVSALTGRQENPA
jgi:hypothetical protein